jgi:L-threonine kinase
MCGGWMRSSACDPALTATSATVRLPGTCGEWVQGALDGVPCLVSCAIDWWAGVTVTLNGAPGPQIRPDAAKSAAALRLALAARDVPTAGATFRLDNPLPRGRGYASSTADVGGTIYAVGAALGRPFAPEEAARLAVQIEPSDSTIFPGPTLFAHRDASFWRPLPSLPALAVVILDPGGAVDTLAFNAADHTAALRRLAPIHRAAFGRFEAGLAAGDPVEAARAATLSAIAHQAILPSALVEAARAAYAELGALGICRAHSGTLVGLICRPEDAVQVARSAAARFPGAGMQMRRCVG